MSLFIGYLYLKEKYGDQIRIMYRDTDRIYIARNDPNIEIKTKIIDTDFT
jgi:hypothetical protein